MQHVQVLYQRIYESGVFLELGHSDKYFNYSTRKKGPAGRSFGYLLLEKLKNCILNKYRSSCQEVFCKKGVQRNVAKFTGKHLCESLFNKVAGTRPVTLLKKRLWHWQFLGICESCKNTIFYRTSPVATSVYEKFNPQIGNFP